MNSAPFAIDEEVLTGLEALQLEGEPDIIVLFIDSFLETSSQKLDELLKSLGRGDLNSARTKAHAIKSGSLLMGASLLGQFCQKMENLRSSNDLAAASIIATSIKIEFEKCSLQLKDIRSRRTSIPRARTHVKNAV